MALVTLVDYTENSERRIGEFAAICYDSDTSDEANLRRAKACVSKGHLSTLRFAYATFKIEGISRACSHQLVRSKHLDYLQESQRYVKQDSTDFVNPSDHYDIHDIFNDAFDDAKYYYNKLLSLGIRKEDARYVLPNASTTSLYVTGNFQAWLDFIKLRTDSAAQWEIRNVANEIKTCLQSIAPNIFS